MNIVVNHIRKTVGALLCIAVVIAMVGCKHSNRIGQGSSEHFGRSFDTRREAAHSGRAGSACVDTNLVTATAPGVDTVTFTATPPTKQVTASAQRHVHMVILVHGTVLPLPSWTAFWESTKQSDGSWYQNYLNQLRYHDLYATQPIGEFGLHVVKHPVRGNADLSINQLATYFLTRAYQSSAKYADDEVVCYTFGWDGRLDHNHRLEWGNRLYQELAKEVTRFKKQHLTAQDTLMIDIFAHSHGGNVALNMVHALADDKHLPWTINRLVLLGTPVQRETAHLIQSPLFNRVYNVYSRGDTIQNLDFLSTKDGKSARRFDGMVDTTKQSKLVQIEVKVDHKKPTHVDLWFFKRWRLSLAVEPRDQVPVFVFVPLAFPSLEGDLRLAHDVVMDIDSAVDAYAVQLQSKQSASLLYRTVCCAKDAFKRPGAVLTAAN